MVTVGDLKSILEHHSDGTQVLITYGDKVLDIGAYGDGALGYPVKLMPDVDLAVMAVPSRIFTISVRDYE